MGHYVFLGSWDHPQMPNGAHNEWARYLGHDTSGPPEHREELEAKGDLPLFWGCLFSENDLKTARLIDDIDVANAEERADFLATSGYASDTVYPYYITRQSDAVTRLERRRAAILGAIGTHYVAAYDGFADLIRNHFGPYILVRTSDLPDAPDVEPWLREDAAAFDKLDAAGSIPTDSRLNAKIKHFHDWEKSNPVWLLSGHGQLGLWPTDAIKTLYRPGSEGGVSAPTTDQNSVKPKGFLDAVVEWFSPVAAAVVGLGTFYWSRMWWVGMVFFFVTAVCLVLLQKPTTKK